MNNITFNKSACTSPCMWRSLCTLASVSRLFVQLLQSALTNTTWKKTFHTSDTTHFFEVDNVIISIHYLCTC